MSQNCLVKGTLITLENAATKKIENLKVGEKLLSYSIEGLENTQDKNALGKTKVKEFEGEFSYQLIKNIWKNKFERYYKINDILDITGDHFVICQKQRKNEYYWIKVYDLRVGDLLFKLDGSFENVNNIELIKEEKSFYNIEVNSIFSYFAQGYLVHNGTACSSTACNTCYNLGDS